MTAIGKPADPEADRRTELSDVHPASAAEDLRLARRLFDAAPGGMVMTRGPRHIVRRINPTAAGWFGCNACPDDPWEQVLASLGDLPLTPLLDEVYASGTARAVRAVRTSVRGADGARRAIHVKVALQPVQDAGGGCPGIFCQATDVTREVEVAERLRASQVELKAALESTQAIIETSHDLICTIDRNGVFTQINGHVEPLLGLPPHQIVGRNYRDFMHPDDLAYVAEVERSLYAGVKVAPFQVRHRRLDGTWVPIMWSAVPSPSRGAIYGIGRDMREVAAAEERLRRAQRMDALGRLTGGVAHDFNNLLTAVIGSAEALVEGLADRPDLQPTAQVTLDAATRGAELVRQLLAVARSQPLEPKPLDGARFLQALTPMLRRTLGPNIDIQVETSPAPVGCLADHTQLTSAILNLCINARDAMPDGGQIRLAVRTSADHAVFSVIDTGEGMSDEVQARALEPFFTTKPPGKGSGLGLSMVYGFAVQSGGRLEIRSAPGAGAEVRIFLKAAAPPPEADAEPLHEPARGMAPRVLLVEDDDLVRGQAMRQLKALGCLVTPCADAAAALDILAGEAPLDLMMTDFAMPGGMNGRELADHCRLLRPRLPILVSSGYANDPILNGPGLASIGAFIPKPYRRAELARKLAELLPAMA